MTRRDRDPGQLVWRMLLATMGALAVMWVAGTALALENFSTDKPGAVSVVPFNLSDDPFAGIPAGDRVGFAKFDNLTGEPITLQVDFHAKNPAAPACQPIGGEFRCLDRKGSTLIDLSKEIGGPLAGAVIGHAYQTAEDRCGQEPPGFQTNEAVLVDDAIVGTFVRANKNTAAACGDQGVQFGLDGDGRPALPELFATGASFVAFSPYSVGPGSEIFAVTLEERADGRIAPLNGVVCGDSTFRESNGNTVLLPPLQVQCSQGFPIDAETVSTICALDPFPPVCRRDILDIERSGHVEVRNLRVARKGQSCNDPDLEPLGQGKHFAFAWAFHALGLYGACTQAIALQQEQPPSGDLVDPETCTCSPFFVETQFRCEEDSSVVCTPDPSPTPQPTSAPEPSLSPSPAPTPSPSPTPAVTPSPSATETPGPTVAPTASPEPTAAPTPEATPIVTPTGIFGPT